MAGIAAGAAGHGTEGIGDPLRRGLRFTAAIGPPTARRTAGIRANPMPHEPATLTGDGASRIIELG